MVPAARHPPGTGPARGAGTELLLLRPGSLTDLERSLALFAGTELTCVLSPPSARSGSDHDEQAWAARLARAHAAPHVLLSELAGAERAESDQALAARAWPALERELACGHVRVLAVLAYDLVRVSVACALGLSLARSRALRLDPARLVLLRDEPVGLVLRCSNVLFPRAGAGTALPGGRPAAARPAPEGTR